MRRVRRPGSSPDRWPPTRRCTAKWCAASPRVAGGAWDISSKTVALTQSLEAHPGLGYAGLIGANLVKLAPLLIVISRHNPSAAPMLSLIHISEPTRPY